MPTASNRSTCRSGRHPVTSASAIRREEVAMLPYTDRARAAIAAARAHARDLGHDRIHPGHLLLGVLSAGDGGATRVLAATAVPVGALGPRIEEVLGRGGPTAGPDAPLSPGAKRALRLAGAQASG